MSEPFSSEMKNSSRQWQRSYIGHPGERYKEEKCRWIYRGGQLSPDSPGRTRPTLQEVSQQERRWVSHVPYSTLYKIPSHWVVIYVRSKHFNSTVLSSPSWGVKATWDHATPRHVLIKELQVCTSVASLPILSAFLERLCWASLMWYCGLHVHHMLKP